MFCASEERNWCTSRKFGASSQAAILNRAYELYYNLNMSKNTMMWKKAVVIGYINKSTACKAVPFSAAAGIKKKQTGYMWTNCVETRAEGK